MSRSAGNRIHQAAATISVPTPPKTMAPDAPRIAPATPDSKSPAWFEAPMKMFSTARTLPRADAGVTSGTRVERMNMLTASAPDRTAMATSATVNEVVRPSAIVPTPNTATTPNNVLPTRRRTGRSANKG